MTVRFLDGSIGFIQSWQWNFNSEGSSMARNPEFTFKTPGNKTIMLIMQGDSEDQSSVNLSITIRSAPSKGWFQRFWWILPTALFLSFVFDQIFEKIEKAGDQPLVSPNKKMRVEVSVSQADAVDDGTGDEFVYDLPAKVCYFQRHSHLGFSCLETTSNFIA